MTYIPDPTRYDHAIFRRCGRSGLVFRLFRSPVAELRRADVFETDAVIRRASIAALRISISHNYGRLRLRRRKLGEILRKDFRGLRNELVISPRPAGICGRALRIGGSRKYMLASLDESLKRMASTTLTLLRASPVGHAPLVRDHGPLVSAVHQGKALYVGISSYSRSAPRSRRNSQEHGVPLLIHQPSYSMLNRWIENGLLATLDELGAGCIAFSLCAGIAHQPNI